MSESLSTREDLEDVVRHAFPMMAERFSLVEHGTVLEEEAGFSLVLRATIFRPREGDQETLRVESVRAQRVTLVRRTAMPLREDRLKAYLAAVDEVVTRQPYERLKDLPPQTWFRGDLLDDPRLVTKADFLLQLSTR